MKKVLFSLSLIGLSLLSNAQTWQGIETAAPALHFPSVVKMVDANTIWFSDSKATAATDTGRYIGVSTDGGATWSNKLITAPAAAATIGDIHPVSATTAYMVSSGTGSQNGIWKTTDSGTTWTKQTSASYSTTTSSAASFANVVYFWDANNGFTAGDPIGPLATRKFEMYSTTNGGTNWTAISSAPAPLGGAEFGYTSKITVSGNNIWLGTDIGRLLYSPNRGTSWQAFQTPAVDFGGVTTADNVASVAFKDSTNGLLITYDYVVEGSEIAILYSTSDSGQTWEPVENTGTFYPSDIVYVPGTPNTYVTSGSDGSSYSTDGGLTWTDIAYDPTTSPYKGSLAFLNSTTGFAGGFSQTMIDSLPIAGIYKFNGDLSLAVSDANASKAKLVAYPNPATDVVKLKSAKEIKSVNILDLSGKVVKTVKTTSEVNVSSLNKGVYILQASYKDGSFENTKVIKK